MMMLYTITFNDGFYLTLEAKDKRHARREARLYVSEIGYGDLRVVRVEECRSRPA